MFHVVIVVSIMILDVWSIFLQKKEILTEFSETTWFILFENVEFNRKKSIELNRRQIKSLVVFYSWQYDLL